MNEINEVKEPTTETNQKPDLIGRFAEVNGMSREEAEALVKADTDAEILEKIKKFTVEKINKTAPPLNRKQRRALAKQMKKQQGKVSKAATNNIAETTKKLNYIDLIQKLRELNAKKENENYVDEEHGSTSGKQ